MSPESATVTLISLAEPARRPPADRARRAVPHAAGSATRDDPGRAQLLVVVCASRWLHANIHVGDTLNMAALRGEFTLTDADTPVVLVSAGVGATPVLAMLYELAATHSTRPVWWFHAARRPADHPFAEEVGRLVDALPEAHLHVRYSASELVSSLPMSSNGP